MEFARLGAEAIEAVPLDPAPLDPAPLDPAIPESELHSESSSKSESALKPESWAWHLLGLIVPFSVIFGNMTGGIWVISTAVLTLIIYPLLDATFGQSKVVRPVRENGRPLEIILHSM